MSRKELEKVINYIVKQGLFALKSNANERNVLVNYVAIFSKNKNEYQNIKSILEGLGKEVDRENAKTGRTFLLSESIRTPAGDLRLVKIRKPDATRPQRGAPDFKIQNYQKFKKNNLQSSGNFTLMTRKDYEMIELKGIDVLVYIPSQTLSRRLLIN